MLESTERRQPPPFAGKIDRDSDLVMIYCGRRAWELARPDAETGRIASLVFPYYKKASEYQWPVEDKHVLILTAESLRWHDDLVFELLAAGANAVHVRGPEIPLGMWSYERSTRDAA